MSRSGLPTMRSAAAILAVLGAATSGAPASAGVYTDDLAKCLVKASSSDDRVIFVQWMFSAMALHPAVQPMAAVTAERREAADQKMAALFSRLLTQDCRKEALDAMKYEGREAVSASFRLLGQVAGQDLLTDPRVVKGMSGLAASFKGDEKLKALLSEAGIAK